MLALAAIPNSNMEPALSSAQHQNLNKVVANGKKSKRSKNSCGVRKVGSRIYDSANGKTCHQCRQKTRDFSAQCKNERKGKPCPIKFCHKCLLNRYGQSAEAVALLGDWKCPKCIGLCNCSYCMKKQGQLPTGPLYHTAKASGYKCVSEMLAAKAANKSEDLELNKVNDVAVLASKEATVEKELVVVLSGELGKENTSDVNVQKASLHKVSKKTKRKELKEISNGSNADGARKKKSLKRPKICEEVPSEEAKGKANDDTDVCNKVSEEETEVDSNHDTAWAADDCCLDINEMLEKDAKGKYFSGLQAQVHRNRYTVFWDPASDFFNSKYHDTKHMHGEYWNKTVLVNDDGDNKFHAGMAKLSNVGMNWEIEKIKEEIPLPPGTELTEVLDIEFPPEAVGSALQLLEFCKVFGKALDLKNGEAEAMLRELVRKQSLRRGQNTLVVQFQIRVLTLIQTDSRNESPSLTACNGDNSWLKPLGDLITESYLLPKDFPLDWLQEGIDGYYNLDLSKKLTLMNFLCDEALGTQKVRSYIEERNSRHAEEVKARKSKVAAAKEKEKGLKQKLQTEMAKAVTSNVAPLSMEEHDALLTQIKSEVAQAHAEMLALKVTIPKGKPSSDAMRIQPEFLDSNGQVFWKLKSYNGEHAVLLQDIKIGDETATATAPEEKWFVYGPEKKDEVDKYISSRAKRLKSCEVSQSEANM